MDFLRCTTHKSPGCFLHIDDDNTQTSPTSRWSWWGTAAKPQGMFFSCFRWLEVPGYRVMQIAIPLIKGGMSKDSLTSNPFSTIGWDQLGLRPVSSDPPYVANIHKRDARNLATTTKKTFDLSSCRRCIYLGYIIIIISHRYGRDSIRTWSQPLLTSFAHTTIPRYKTLPTKSTWVFLELKRVTRFRGVHEAFWRGRILVGENHAMQKHADTRLKLKFASGSDGGKIGLYAGDLFLALHIQMVDYQLPQ